jgi:hypothetical protein
LDSKAGTSAENYEQASFATKKIFYLLYKTVYLFCFRLLKCVQPAKKIALLIKIVEVPVKSAAQMIVGVIPAMFPGKP